MDSSDFDPHPINGYLDPHELAPQMAPRSGQPFLHTPSADAFQRSRQPLKIAYSLGGSAPHLIHVSLGPPKSASQTASRSVQPFLQGSRTWPTNRQTMLLLFWQLTSYCCLWCGLTTTTILVSLFMLLSSWRQPLWQYTQVHLMRQTQYQVATNPQAKPANRLELWAGESTCRLLLSASTVAIYYCYSALWMMLLKWLFLHHVFASLFVCKLPQLCICLLFDVLIDVMSRWKEECSSIARKMEHNMSDSRNELTRERRRNEELTRLLRESRDKTIEVRVVVFDGFGDNWRVNCVGVAHLCCYINTLLAKNCCNGKWVALLIVWLVEWLSGRTSVFGRRTFPVLHSICSWRVTTYVGKPSAMGHPTRSTQPFIPSGSIDE